MKRIMGVFGVSLVKDGTFGDGGKERKVVLHSFFGGYLLIGFVLI